MKKRTYTAATKEEFTRVIHLLTDLDIPVRAKLGSLKFEYIYRRLKYIEDRKE